MENNTNIQNNNVESINNDALLIFFNKDSKMRILGDKSGLQTEDEYLKVSIKQGQLSITKVKELDFTDNDSTYFPHYLDCEFVFFILNYCNAQQVPGIYLQHTGDVYIDMKYSAPTIEQIVKNKVDLLKCKAAKYKEIINLTDVYFNSIDYNTDNIFNSEDYVLKEYALFRILFNFNEKKSPIEAALSDAIWRLYNELLHIVAGNGFRSGYNFGTKNTRTILTMPAGKIRIELPDDDEGFEVLDDEDFEDWDDEIDDKEI